MNNLNHSRKLEAWFCAAGLLVPTDGAVLGAVRYVDVSNANPTPPYTSWASAATNIQDAVDAAVGGDEIAVTNGFYSIGDRVTTNGLWSVTFNRVVADKVLSLRSVNGPAVTIIDGGGSHRCVYLANGASLSGFTLTNGSAQSGGGVFCESTNAAVSYCVVSGNSAYWSWLAGLAQGGGVYGGTLTKCILSGNSARASDPLWGASGTGGGASGSTLNNCTLIGNSAEGLAVGNPGPMLGSGGGASGCLLNNCSLIGNFAGVGGGAIGSTLNNCTITGNSGWGVWERFQPPGVGGAYASTLNNCIVYFNWGFYDNCDPSSTLNYCCTIGQLGTGDLDMSSPTNGVGNITNAPLFVDTNGWANLRLQPTSPCINAGNNDYAVGATDLDGNPRINRGVVDIGAYEFQANIRYVDVTSTNPTPPYTNWATAAAVIQDAVDAAMAGDEIVVTNGIYATGERVTTNYYSWAMGFNRVVVDKALSLRSVNGPAVTLIDGGRSNRCVYLTNGASLSGFTLTNGVGQYGHGSGWDPGYKIGGGLWCESPSAVASNCVISGNYTAAEPDGIWGKTPGVGGGVYGGTLNNCALNGNLARGMSGNGGTPSSGGGAANATLNHCTVTGNTADYGGPDHWGGGVSGCTLNNCTLSGNWATDGGGASGSTLNHCTLIGNWASMDGGGGAAGCALNNCIVYFNDGANYDSFSTLNYCCTTPLPTNGIGNISADPLFMDTNGWANLRLQPTSPCINAGNNAYAVGATDLDGKPRIKGGTVDIGAYEVQLPTSMISYAWLQYYGLRTDGSADFADPDGDGLNNWQEWRCRTDPTNALSALRLLAPAPVGSDLVVRWESVAGRTYFLERSTTASSGFTPLTAGIPGQPGMTAYTDTNTIGTGPWFYRVGVGD